MIHATFPGITFLQLTLLSSFMFLYYYFFLHEKHWLFLPKWASVFPNATIYLAPPALGEDLTTKVKEYATDTFPQSENQWVILTESGTQVSSKGCRNLNVYLT